MEEQKKNGKVVGMGKLSNDKTVDTQMEPQKLSYEELNNAAIQLSKENQYLKAQLQGATETLRTINRLDYLFKVLESSHHFDSLFIGKCVDEIKKIMTPPEESEEAKKN